MLNPQFEYAVTACDSILETEDCSLVCGAGWYPALLLVREIWRITNPPHDSSG